MAYLSAEYLPGPHLANNLCNLGITKQTREALEELDIQLDDLLEQEEEPGLGNGGLGRLASCYMDSLATLGIPAIAYGIRYEFGIFDQMIQDGWQAISLIWTVRNTYINYGFTQRNGYVNPYWFFYCLPVSGGVISISKDKRKG